jgi:hypothetical protein
VKKLLKISLKPIDYAQVPNLVRHKAKNHLSCIEHFSFIFSRGFIMRFAKSCIVFVCIAALLCALCTVTGCGDAVAAKWAHGKVLEADVTTQIEALQSNESLSDDKAGWEKYIKKYKYDDDADKAEVKAKSGTVAKLREYEIKILVEQQILEYEVEQAGIEVSDDDVESAYEQQAQMYEQMYAGGLSGTFESILEMMGYENADAFKADLKESLKQEKYKKQVLGLGDDEEIDDDKWQEYIDGKYDEAEVEITDCPSDLSYDPANMSDEEAASDEDSSASETEESTDTTSSGE